MFRFHTLFHQLSLPVLDVVQYKKAFEDTIFCIKDHANNPRLMDALIQTMEQGIWNKEGKFFRIDAFWAINWEILYYCWKTSTMESATILDLPDLKFSNTQEEIVVSPKDGRLVIPEKFQWIYLTDQTEVICSSSKEEPLPKKIENHLLFSVMPTLMKRGSLESGRIKFANPENIAQVQFFLIQKLWNLLSPSLELLHVSPTQYMDLENPEEGGSEKDPFFWFFFYGSKLSNAWNPQDIYIKSMFSSGRILKKEYWFVQKSPLLKKIIEDSIEKKLIECHESYFFKRVISFIPRLWKKIHFRFNHSLSLSVLLLITIFLLVCAILEAAWQYQKAGMAKLRDTTKTMSIFSESEMSNPIIGKDK